MCLGIDGLKVPSHYLPSAISFPQPYPPLQSPHTFSMSVALNTSSFSSPDFIIPTWALGDVSEALESTSHWATDRMQEQMVTTLLSTIFLGA